LVSLVKGLKIGKYDDAEEPFMGPLIHSREVERTLKMQEKLLAEGAGALVEGRRLQEGMPFLTPALLDVTQLYFDQKLPDEEVFGPQLKLIRVKTLEEAVNVANDTKFGLSSAIFSEDRAEYDYCVTNVRAGLLNWNKMTTGASGMAPFGGCGLSGNHRPAGFYAADYCAYPVASMEQEGLSLPERVVPGVSI
jgi:succinylglutamic semialdehyde dehydrogenase